MHRWLCTVRFAKVKFSLLEQSLALLAELNLNA
jgi:hypothetical protein